MKDVRPAMTDAELVTELQRLRKQPERSRCEEMRIETRPRRTCLPRVRIPSIRRQLAASQPDVDLPGPPLPSPSAPPNGMNVAHAPADREVAMIAGGWIWFLPLPWEWRTALSNALPCEFGGTQCY